MPEVGLRGRAPSVLLALPLVPGPHASTGRIQISGCPPIGRMQPPEAAGGRAPLAAVLVYRNRLQPLGGKVERWKMFDTDLIKYSSMPFSLSQRSFI